MEGKYQRKCQRMGCDQLIDPKRKLARFCSPECRLKDHREMRKNAEICVCACGHSHERRQTRRKKSAKEVPIDDE